MAGKIGQAVIQEHHVGLQGSRLFLRFGTIASFAHDFDLGIDFLDLAQTLSQGRVIINDQQLDGVLLLHVVIQGSELRETSA